MSLLDALKAHRFKSPLQAREAAIRYAGGIDNLFFVYWRDGMTYAQQAVVRDDPRIRFICLWDHDRGRSTFALHRVCADGSAGGLVWRGEA